MSKPIPARSIAVSLTLLGLAACQPAAETAVQSDATSAESSAENTLIEAVNATETEVETVSASAGDDHDHDGDHGHKDDDHDHESHDHDGHDDHDHGAHKDDDHDHDAHDHDEHDDHDHDEHDHDKHDHEGHDHAGGEAHLHGHAELAVTRDGATVSVSLMSPLANFGLSESNPDIGDTQGYGDAVITLIGGDCSETGRAIDVETDGQHGQMQVDLTFTCASISGLTGATTTLFSQYPGFEEIDAVILTETDQAATVLTPTQDQLTFP